MQNTKNTAPNPAAVDPMITGQRQAYIKAYFQHYGVWNDDGWESLLKKTEEKLCQLVAGAKYMNVNQAYFVFEADRMAWGKHVKACGLDAKEHYWPWAVLPNPSHLTEGVSAQYIDWRSAKGLPLEDPEVSIAAKVAATAAAAAAPKSASQRQNPSTQAPSGPTRSTPAEPKQAPSAPASRKPSNSKLAPSGQSSSGPASRKPSNSKPAPSGQSSSGPASRKPSNSSPAPSRQVQSTSASRKPHPSRPAGPLKVGESSAAAAKKPPQVEEIRSLLGGIQLEEAAKEKARADEVATKAATKAAQSNAAKAIFDAEMARIAVSNAAKAQAVPVGSGTDDLGIVDPPVLPENASIPLRDGYRADMKVIAQPPKISDPRLREMIWRALRLEAPSGPVTGCFQIVIPPWVDFYDLVFGENGCLYKDIVKNSLLPRGVSISWMSDRGRPVTLVAGPDPNVGHNADDRNLHLQMRSVWYKIVEWAMGAYQGSPLRLTDYLRCRQRLELDLDLAVRIGTTGELMQVWERVNSDPTYAAQVAEKRKQNLVAWTPEVHAILKQPSRSVGVMLQDWVMREGLDIAGERTDIARDIWGFVDPASAWEWEQHITSFWQ
ncbi:hypothetical protein ACHAP7_008745 [Fusarium lateritium]